MVTVKFFGLISIDCNIARLEASPGTVSQVIRQITELKPEVDVQRLNRALIFINKREFLGNKRFSVSLKDGDELVFLNPSSGG